MGSVKIKFAGLGVLRDTGQTLYPRRLHNIRVWTHFKLLWQVSGVLFFPGIGAFSDEDIDYKVRSAKNDQPGVGHPFSYGTDLYV